MEGLRKASTEERAQTDASLAAERAALDTTDDDRALRRAHRVTDDLIERDREAADARLLLVRSDADGLRTTDDRGVDEGRTAERAATDALVEGERELADAAVALGRREHDEDRARLAATRLHTEQQSFGRTQWR